MRTLLLSFSLGALSACAHPPAAPQEAACYPAHFTAPCGASAWEIELPGGPTTAFVRGPGAPRVGLDILQAPGNTWALCGELSSPVQDAECGEMPMFEARSFRLSQPVTRLDCGAMLADCIGEDGAPRTTSGPLVQEDLEDCVGCTLRCEGAECWIQVN